MLISLRNGCIIPYYYSYALDPTPPVSPTNSGENDDDDDDDDDDHNDDDDGGDDDGTRWSSIT